MRIRVEAAISTSTHAGIRCRPAESLRIKDWGSGYSCRVGEVSELAVGRHTRRFTAYFGRWTWFGRNDETGTRDLGGPTSPWFTIRGVWNALC